MTGKRIVLIILGILLALTAVESSLQIAGFIVRKNSVRLRSANKDSLKILCLGDSYTYGLGVEENQSYPAQLQNILNSNRKEKKIEVINCGMPGFNTPLLEENILKIMDNYQPDIVLIMIGINDSWNYSGFKEPAVSLSKRISVFGDRLKISRMFRIFSSNFFSGSGFDLQAKDTRAIKKTLSVYRANPQLSDFYYLQAVLMGNKYRDKDMFEQAKLCYDYAKSVRPEGELVARELIRYYKKGLIQNKVRNESAVIEENMEIIIKYVRSIYLFVQKADEKTGFLKGFDEIIDYVKISRQISGFEDTLLLLTKVISLYGFNDAVWEEADELFIAWRDPGKAIRFYEILRQKYGDKPEVLLRLARQYKILQDYARVKEYSKMALRVMPDNEAAKAELGFAEFFLAQKLSRKYLLQQDSDKVYEQIRAILNHDHKERSASWDNGIAFKNKPANNDKLLPNTGIKQEKIRIEAGENLSNMCRLAKARNIETFLLNYPMSDIPRIRQTASEQNAGFIDINTSFLPFIDPDNLEQYFQADGHCTAKGNKVIAETAAGYIADILPEEQPEGGN